MGLNRSHPLLYAASAQKVLDAKPEWVLAEHGGAFRVLTPRTSNAVWTGARSARRPPMRCASAAVCSMTGTRIAVRVEADRVQGEGGARP